MRVFISYRRSDSQDVAGRIFDFLVSHLSRRGVFKDVDSIPLSVPFSSHIKEVLAETDVVLVLIGPNWLTATGIDGQRRLNDPEDPIRVEIETAFALGVSIIPITVSNALMPTSEALPDSLRFLCGLNGQSVRPDPDFYSDMKRLLRRFPGQSITDSSILGRWRCNWTVASVGPRVDDKPTHDVVEITETIGDKVYGTGYNFEYGNFVLDGWISELSLTFMYEGAGEDKPMKGAIVLKREDSQTTMTGIWAQYVISADIVIHGETVWERMRD